MDLDDLTEYASSFMPGIKKTTYKGEALTDPHKIHYNGIDYLYNSKDRYDLIDYLFDNDLVSLDDVLSLSKSYCNKDLKNWFKENGETC